MPMLFVCLALVVPSFAGATLYQERARALQAQSEAAAIAKVNRHFDSVEARFMLNLANFGRAHGGFQSVPQCRDRESRSSWGGGRQVCGSGLCVNVSGSAGGGRNERSAMSVEIYRRYEMISSCDVVMNSGLACAVDYIMGANIDSWIQGFGGTCIDGAGQSRTLRVPFRNIKFD